MGDPDFWVPVLVVVQILGVVLALVAGGRLYRSNIEEAERRRAAGLTDFAPGDHRVSVRLLQAKADEELPGRELVVLQTLAKALVARRPVGLVIVGLVLGQAAWMFMDVSIWLKLLVALWAVLYAAAAFRIERDARVGAAFLRRHPLSVQA
ncbi:hypothetical protein [Kineosporia babensis]|uniref:Uncharacterized protein n=1 Tax=Kineosporia babensis TaxID=499548 RepID=A0A9X1NE38_9ACTN|nr:hypothetical protein [Kineosporia babensis]MCD5311616.1 hypothetical protein [Kineosporia babensis]